MTARVVFTDLDGTLLDPQTRSFDAALPALELLDRLGVPVVFCTSKTRAEVEVLRRRLHNHHPFIVENGGAAFIPRGYFPLLSPPARTASGYQVIELGSPYSCLTAALDRASQESGCPVRAFHEMSAGDVAALSGLGREEAARAIEREYDEPFSIPDARRSRQLLSAIERQGKRWTRGDAWYHITGFNDKALAAAVLTALYRRAWGRVLTIGLGDAPNDAPLLRATRVSYVVGSPFAAALQQAVPHARLARFSGPAGWNAAVLECFSSRTALRDR